MMTRKPFMTLMIAAAAVLAAGAVMAEGTTRATTTKDMRSGVGNDRTGATTNNQDMATSNTVNWQKPNTDIVPAAGRAHDTSKPPRTNPTYDTTSGAKVKSDMRPGGM